MRYSAQNPKESATILDVPEMQFYNTYPGAKIESLARHMRPPPPPLFPCVFAALSFYFPTVSHAVTLYTTFGIPTNAA